MGKYSQRKSNSVLRRIRRKALIILIIFGIPALLFITVFHIKNVEVIGTDRYTPDQIKAFVIQTKPESNSLYLYFKYKYFSQPELPFIQKMDIELKNASSVKITVYEKMIAGCVEFMGEFMYFDKDGIVVESSPQKLDMVPVIKGLKFGEIILYEKLKVQKADQLELQADDQVVQAAAQADEQAAKPAAGPTGSGNEEQTDKIFDVIIDLTLLIQKYELKIDTITFGNNYEVTLDSGEITIFLGKKSSYDEVLAELKNVLKEADGMAITFDLENYVKGTDIIGKPKKSTE